mgnify:FL=1
MKAKADVISVTLEKILIKQHNLMHPTLRHTARDKSYSEIDEFV